MSEPISSIRNLGPAYERELEKIGVTTAEQLRDMGADAAYGALLNAGTRPHFVGYYVLVMALQGRPWNDCKGEEKKALRVRFDKLKEERFDTGLSKLEAELNAIGVIKR